MKKWLFIVGLLLILIITGCSAYFYQVVRGPLVEEQNRAVEYVLKNSELKTIDTVSHYYGSENYQVIKGKDEDGTALIAWVSPENDEVVVHREDEGLTVPEIRELIMETVSPKEIVSIRLGIENNLPVYEVTYIDEDARYVYYYVTFKDGTFVKRYSLKQD